MGKERAKEVAESLVHLTASIFSGDRATRFETFISNLPEFQDKPKEEWIKCSERMPEANQSVYLFFGSQKGEMTQTYFKPELGTSATHWMECAFPAPPPEEESEQIKELKAASEKFDTMAGTTKLIRLCDVVEIVKRHEKASKK